MNCDSLEALNMTTETSELRRIRIDGLLPKGEYVTEQEYTAEQEDEMRFVAQEAARESPATERSRAAGRSGPEGSSSPAIRPAFPKARG